MSELVGRALFRAVAPRLERAHRQRRVEVVQERDARGRARAKVLKAERLVAHRDLQLVRAFTTRDSRYIGVRQRKLDQARRELRGARRRAEDLGC